MRKVLTLSAASLAVALVMSLTAPMAVARALTAADFAADCNDDGLITLTGGNTRYGGGTGDILVSCRVELESGAALTLADVALSTSTTADLNIGVNSSGGSSVRIQRSQLTFGGTSVGHLVIDTGYPAPTPTDDKAGGSVSISDSLLQGTYVEVLASPNSSDGRIDISGSTIIGTFGGPSFGVRVGTNGRVDVSRNVVTAPHEVAIGSGDGGRTNVERNDFTAAVGPFFLVTGAGGRCVSTRNTPDVPCL